MIRERPGTTTSKEPSAAVMVASSVVLCTVTRERAATGPASWKRSPSMSTATDSSPWSWPAMGSAVVPGVGPPSAGRSAAAISGCAAAAANVGAVVDGAPDTVACEDGTVAVFAADRIEVHPKDDFPTIEVYGNIDDAQLRLVTCGGDFDSSVRSYEDNVIAFASLVGTRPARPRPAVTGGARPLR